MIVHVLILIGVLGAAGALSVVLYRKLTADEAPELGSALSFVGAAYGLLLGLLVVFAVGHYNDVRDEAQREATTLVSLYDGVTIYPPETSDHIRHDLVCYMRSIADDEWPSMERGRQLEAPRTLRYGDQVRDDVRGLFAAYPAQSSANVATNTLIENAGASRQRLLFLTVPRIPIALWVVIYVGAFLVFSLLAVHHASRPAGRILALGSAAVLMAVAVGVLAMLDQPFGIGVRVQPNQVRQAISLSLTGETSPTVLAPCR